MKIRVWASTDVVGSKTEDVIDLPDEMTEEEIEAEAKDYIFQFVDWGWKKVDER